MGWPRLTLPLLAALLVACSGDSDDTPAGGNGGSPTTPDATTSTGATGDTGPSTPSPTGPTADTAFTSTGGDTRSTAATGATGATADTGTSTLPVIDCAAVSPNPLSQRSVPGARGYHGLVFADDGRLVGSDGNTLLGADIKGSTTVILPGTGSLQQLDKLSDGTLVAASSADGAVFTVDPTTGGTAVLNAGLGFSLYGLLVGPDDKVYAADQDRIVRIDPATGTSEVWLDNANVVPKVLDFNIDYTKMYVGTNSSNGKVFEVPLDANYDPVGPPVELAQTPGSWHDGLTVDICGNIYVAEFNNRAMYRITPSGQVGTLYDLGGANNNQYGHGVVFGTGTDGWLADAIYVPQPYNGNTVAEFVLGVPHRTYPGPVINGP